MNPLRVAMLQTDAGADLSLNLRNVEDLIADLPDVDMLALPEAFTLRTDAAVYRRTAEPMDGATTRRIASWARRRRCWILAGSIALRHGRRVYNTAILFDRDGAPAAMYRKIHLFEASLPDGTSVRESDGYDAGRRPCMTELDGWKAGLSICYDLRFPELYRTYAGRGAHVLFAPSNFTHQTGREHWSILVRARAIENQCYVVAPNQCGVNPATGVAGYGHSLIVGPWGEVLCEAAPPRGF